MITIHVDGDSLHGAVAQLADRIDAGLRRGMELTTESIAARAKQTTTFVDRTSNLRNSIQADEVEGGGGEPIVGIVSFAAVSTPSARHKSGRKRKAGATSFPYGLSQEFGSSNGVKAKHFIRDAIDAENGDLLESGLAAELRRAGFEVSR